MTDEIPLFPIASWQIGQVPQLGIVTFKPDFLTSPFQPPESANPGRHYALSPAQAQALIQDLTAALEKLQSAGFQPPPNPSH